MKTRICLAAAFAMFAVLAPLSAATTLSPTPGGWDVEANRLPAPDSRPPHLRVTNSWDGSSSTNWHTAANWSLNHVPLSTEDVYIPVTGITRWPVLSADGHCNALTVNSGASLTISGCELIVYTDAHLNGGFNMTGNSYLDVYMDLIFGAGALANFNNPGAFILVRGDVEFLAGSSVNIPSTMLDLYGTPVSYVRTYAPTTLGELYTYKPSSGFTSISNLSTHSLTLYMIWVSSNTTLYHPYSGTTYVTGDLLFSDTSLVQMNSGTISCTGGANGAIEINDSDCYLNNLTLNKSGSAVLGLETNLTVRGDLVIQTGVFDPGGWGVTVGGDWINQVGDGGFDEAGSTVVLNGTDDQSISSENFHNLVLNKSAGVMSIPAGSTVSCNSYDWVAGAYTVAGGSFTVADLADPGVFGTITLSAGTITYTQDTEQYIDLRCNLTISGGIFNLYGGNGTAWFSYIDVASLTMTNGTLDFKNQGIRIPASYAFTENISGGGIRTVGSFLIERSDFNPGGGTIELYGSANATLQNTDGSNLYRVFINKSATREGNELWPGSDPRDPQLEPLTRLNQVTGSGPLDINGNLVIN
ncbi:MAG TPA: hypothetical protein PKH19_03875, partial [Candidatus Syntrophosphaera sp.]|nr:hypothetical protein [Candidatus Syntrophosphaera sp.]